MKTQDKFDFIRLVNLIIVFMFKKAQLCINVTKV